MIKISICKINSILNNQQTNNPSVQYMRIFYLLLFALSSVICKSHEFKGLSRDNISLQKYENSLPQSNTTKKMLEKSNINNNSNETKNNGDINQQSFASLIAGIIKQGNKVNDQSRIDGYSKSQQSKPVLNSLDQKDKLSHLKQFSGYPTHTKTLASMPPAPKIQSDVTGILASATNAVNDKSIFSPDVFNPAAFMNNYPQFPQQLPAYPASNYAFPNYPNYFNNPYYSYSNSQPYPNPFQYNQYQIPYTPSFPFNSYQGPWQAPIIASNMNFFPQYNQIYLPNQVSILNNQNTPSLDPAVGNSNVFTPAKTPQKTNITINGPSGTINLQDVDQAKGKIMEQLKSAMKNSQNPPKQNDQPTANQAINMPGFDINSFLANFPKTFELPAEMTKSNPNIPTFAQLMKQSGQNSTPFPKAVFNDTKIQQLLSKPATNPLNFNFANIAKPRFLTDQKSIAQRQFKNEEEFSYDKNHKIINISYSEYIRLYRNRLKKGEVSTFRQHIFEENLKLINKHNLNSKSTYQMGINSFMLVSMQEFIKLYTIQETNMAVPQVIVKSKQKNLQAFDWKCKSQRVQHYQVQFSQIWVVMQTVQILSKMYTLIPPSAFFSIQQITRCPSKSSKQRIQCYFNYFKEHETKQSLTTSSMKNDRKFIRTYRYIEQGNCVSMLNVLKQRVLIVQINAMNLQFYSSGTFDSKTSNTKHRVILMGYDPDKGYLIKNSWGVEWGLHGYGYVDENTGVCHNAIYPMLVQQNHKPFSCPISI